MKKVIIFLANGFEEIETHGGPSAVGIAGYQALD